MDEFDLIERYFKPLTEDRAEASGLQDDAAVLQIPEGRELVVTSDTLNEDTHFPSEALAADVAHKALRVNLSDLAAMGADPFSYQLNLALPDKCETGWLEAFTAALAEDQAEFGIFCSGGDMTRINGPLSISITAMGLVPVGQAVNRSGAQDGDLMVLTGPVGDAGIGLHMGSDSYFLDKYYRPRPRFDLIELMRAHAHAAIDVSDGFIADLSHICEASGIGAEIQLDKFVFSQAAQKLLGAGQVTKEQLLTSGDDYELILAVQPESASHFSGEQIIGRFTSEHSDLRVLDESGDLLSFKHTGWSHF